MKKKPLIQTNPYLKDSFLRDQMFTTTTVSSAAVEGVKIDFPSSGNTHPIKTAPKKKTP